MDIKIIIDKIRSIIISNSFDEEDWKESNDGKKETVYMITEELLNDIMSETEELITKYLMISNINKKEEIVEKLTESLTETLEEIKNEPDEAND